MGRSFLVSVACHYQVVSIIVDKEVEICSEILTFVRKFRTNYDFSGKSSA